MQPKLISKWWTSCLSFSSAGTIGVSCHAWAGSPFGRDEAATEARDSPPVMEVRAHPTVARLGHLTLTIRPELLLERRELEPGSATYRLLLCSGRFYWILLSPVFSYPWDLVSSNPSRAGGSQPVGGSPSPRSDIRYQHHLSTYLQHDS